MTTCLREHVPNNGDPSDPAALEALLEQLVAAGRAGAAGIEVEPACFVKYVAERCEAQEQLAELLPTLHVGDLYLACACLEGNVAALELFDRTCLREVTMYLAHIDSSSHFAEEVRQRLRHKLFSAEPPQRPKIASYSGRGALSKWVGVSAQRIAISMLREEGARQRREARVELLPPGRNPELDYLKARYRVAFRDAFNDAVEELSARTRILLRLSVLKGLSNEAIARMYDVHQATVSRWLTAGRRAILESMQRKLREQLHIETTDVQSLSRLMQSDLDLSLVRLLSETAEP